MHQLLLVCLLWLGGQQATEEACRTCEGEGYATFDCEDCVKGKGECYLCYRPTLTSSLERQLELFRIIKPEETKELEEQIARYEKVNAALAKSGMVRNPGGPGELSCPGRCADGSVLWYSHKCKPCKGEGTVDCKGCKSKGVGRCRTCAGNGSARKICPQCVGARLTQSVARRSAANLSTCPWCADARIVDCHACDESGEHERACLKCASTGVTLCTDCAGTKRIRCEGCASTGFKSRNSDREKCAECKRRGTLPCKACKNGEVVCPGCKGKKRGTWSCNLCFSEKKALCRGCWHGTGRAWTATGEQLLSASGPNDLALEHLRFGLKREEQVAAAKVVAFEGTSNARKAYDRKLKKELLVLRKRIEKAEKELTKVKDK